MSDVLLDIKNLELRYGAAVAVRDISLSVKRDSLLRSSATTVRANPPWSGRHRPCTAVGWKSVLSR